MYLAHNLPGLNGESKGSYRVCIIKPTRCTNFSNLFLEWNSKCFVQFLCSSSGVFHCTHSNRCMSYRFADSLRAGSVWNILILLLLDSCLQTCMTYTITVCTVKNSWWWTEEMLLLASCQQTCMTYNIAVCTVKNSWWWTEELSETCRVSFQNKFEKLLHLVGFTIINTEINKLNFCFN